MSNQARTRVIKIRVTEEESAKIEQLVVSQGTTISELFRQRVLRQQRKQGVETISQQAFFISGQIYNSIKIISQKMEGMKNADKNITTELEKIKTSVKQLQRQIMP